MEDYVTLTGRTRYAAQIIRTGALWWKDSRVSIVLQVEEFYHEHIYVAPDRDGTTYPDRINQGYQWRDATLEDLATMGTRNHEPTVEAVRRHARPYAPRPTEHVGPSAAGPSSQSADDWPSIIRRYPDVPPAGFQETRYPTGSIDAGTQSRTQSPPAPSAGY